MVRAERCAHRGDADPWSFAIVEDERHHFFAQVGIEDRLHVAAVKRMRAAIVKAEAVDGIDAEEFHFAARR